MTKSNRLPQFNVQRAEYEHICCKPRENNLGLYGDRRAGFRRFPIDDFVFQYFYQCRRGGTPCSVSGSGAGFASCESTGNLGNINDAFASVTVTDNSLEFYLSSEHAAPAQAFASVTHDDFYSVPVDGPVSVLEHLTCSSSGPFTTAHFSLGSTNVSPPVESIFPGVSQQGSGLCGNQYQFAPLPTDFVVSLLAVNNIVDLQTHIDASGRLADFTASYFVQITVDGFLDANGNPIVATLLTPEPGTLGTFALAVLLGVGVKWARGKTGSLV